jgi:hypothetical protein
MTHLLHLNDHRRRRRRIYFNRVELGQLLQLYSSRVARGEWRDYAIDHQVGAALFSVFRHTHDRPLFAIAKFPGTGDRQADYALLSGRRNLGRSHSLSDLLRLFDRPLALVPEG